MQQASDDPLDEQTFEIDSAPSPSGKDHVSALHPHWKQDICFIEYQPPVLKTADEATHEEWMERASLIEQDFHVLLKLPHRKFWCQCIFDSTLHKCIDSYLQSAPRPHDEGYEMRDDVGQQQRSLHRLMFLTLLRMATHKESKENFITPKVFGRIIYDNFLFDIPKLMDMCALFKDNNQQLLGKMVENIFSQQSKYLEDLKQAVPTMMKVYDTLEKECGLSHDEEEVRQLSSSDPLLSLPSPKFQDLLFYYLDISATLENFLETCGPARKVWGASDMPARICGLYNVVVPAFRQALKQRTDLTPEQVSMLRRKLARAARAAVSSVRLFVNSVFLQHVMENSGDSAVVEETIEKFIDFFTSVLHEKYFLGDYAARFPVADDVELLQQTSYVIDETRSSYITGGFTSALGARRRKRKVPRSSPEGAEVAEAKAPVEVGEVSGPRAVQDHDEDQIDMQRRRERRDEGACAFPRPSDVQLTSLISSVRDLLPDLGEGFVERCLEELGYEQELVVASLLEDHLPPSLASLDRTLPRLERAPSPPPEVVAPESEGGVETLLSQRKNIYDRDEFDVFSRDTLDMNRVHLGKKDHGSDATQLLDDKAEVKQLRGFYEQFDTVTEIVTRTRLPSFTDNDIEYDDEYDDTYDEHMVGAEDAGGESLTVRRPFTVPRVLGGNVQDSPADDDEEETEEKEGEGSRPQNRGGFIPFASDPAAARERREQAWRARGGGPRKQHDVKGSPRGQGQDSDVTKNRTYKDKHKSSVGNHNRRAMADRKRAAFK